MLVRGGREGSHIGTSNWILVYMNYTLSRLVFAYLPNGRRVCTLTPSSPPGRRDAKRKFYIDASLIYKNVDMQVFTCHIG